MSQIPPQAALSHVISLASCPGKCQAPNVCVFAPVVLRSYWNTFRGLFCVRLRAQSDIEKKQVESERGALDCVVFNADSRRPGCLAAPSFLPFASGSFPCAPRCHRASFCVSVSPLCTPAGLVKTSYLLTSERNVSSSGRTWSGQLPPAWVSPWVKGAPRDEVS